LFVRRVAGGRFRLAFLDRGTDLRLGVLDTRVTFLSGCRYAPESASSRRMHVANSVTAPTFEDLSVGDEGPPLVVEDVSRTQLRAVRGRLG
jgi:hypothetical protein